MCGEGFAWVVCVCVCVFVCACMCSCVYVVCMCVHVYVCVCVHVQVSGQAYVHEYTHIYVRTCVAGVSSGPHPTTTNHTHHFLVDVGYCNDLKEELLYDIRPCSISLVVSHTPTYIRRQLLGEEDEETGAVTT